MTQEELNEIARNIIKNNCYLTLATTFRNEPWAAPLYYDVDEKYNFYYISQLDSLHIKHILKNPKVAFAIFDSRQKPDTGNGVQGNGKVYEIMDKDLAKAFKLYKSNFIPKKKENFSGKAAYRFFKLISQKFYVLDPEAKVDKRVEAFIL